MSLSIANIAAAIADAAPVVTATSKLFSFVGGIMDAAEAAFKGANQSGADKKVAVLAGLAAVAAQIGADFEAEKDTLSSYIDLIKQTFNLVKADVKEGPASADANAARAAQAVDAQAVADANQRSK